MGQLDRRQGDAAGIEFLTQHIQYARIVFQVVRRECFFQRGDRYLNLPSPEVSDRRNLSNRNLLFRESFDVTEQSLLAGFGQRDRGTLTTGPPNATNSVHIGFRSSWDVIVHDVRELIDVEPTCRHIGSDQQFGLTIADAAHHFVALILAHSSVERFRPVSATIHGLGQLIDLRTRAAKHQCRRGRLDIKDPTERGRFMGPLDDVDRLAHQGFARLGIAQSNLDFQRVAKVTFGDRIDSWRHGRREQHGLSFGRGSPQDFFDVIRETHVQHFVGLIEHNNGNPIERQRATGDVVKGAARGRNDHVHSAGQGLQLPADRLSAVDRHNLRPEIATIFVHSFGDLHGKFPGGDEHKSKRLGLGLRLLDQLQNWKGKRRCLSSAGSCLTNQITPLQQQWNRFPLNRRWFLVAQSGKRLQKLRSKTQIGKGFWRTCVGHGFFGRVAMQNGIQGCKDKRPIPAPAQSDGITAGTGQNSNLPAGFASAAIPATN